jgi:predicted nucleic acid-binding protein
MNNIVFDSSAIISISEKCFIAILEKLAKNSNASFLIPQAVNYEIVEHPLQIRRFELNAIRIKKAVEKGWIKVMPRDQETQRQMQKLLETANNAFFIGDKPITLIQEGEAEALALAKEIGAKIVVIDERTARMILEDPMRLKERLSRGIDKEIKADNNKLSEIKKMLSGIEIVRSCELIALAFEKGYFENELSQSNQAIEAALFALRYSGCAVSEQEITEYLKTKR